MSFPEYEHYKDSGIEWLGELPKDWSVSRLGFEAWVRARLGWKGLKADEYVDDGFPMLATPNIKGKHIDFDGANKINKFRFDESPEIQLRLGDVVLAKDGSTLGTVNVVRALPQPATVNSSIAVITPKPSLNGSFLAYLFQSAFMINMIASIKGGMGVPHLFQEDLNKFYLPLPPINHQFEIVTFLDLETTKLDALITEQRTLVDLLREKRQAVISHAVTKGLDPRVPMKDSGVEWLGEVPAHWRMTRLGFIASQINDINHEMPEAVAEGVPFLSAKDLDDYGNIDFDGDVKLISEDDFERLSRKICPRRGDIVYSRIGTIGRACVVRSDVKFLVSYSCCIVRVESSDVFLDFLRDLLASDLILTESKSRIRSMGQPDLGLGEIRRFPIPLPPVDEQMTIDKHLKIEIGGIDKLLSESQNAITLLQERRSALISAAVTGKIDVRHVSQSEPT